MAQNQTPPAEFDRASWQRRVREVQQAQATPTRLLLVQQRHERRRTQEKQARQARHLSRVSDLAMHATSSAYKSFSDDGRYRPLGNLSNTPPSRRDVVQPILNQMVNLQSAVSLNNDDDEEEGALVLDQVELGLQEQGVDTRTNPNAEIDLVLAQLRVEPQNNEESFTKFQLYETFLETVVATREKTLECWEQSKEQFEGQSFRALERQIGEIDSERAMSMADVNNVWFVHTMFVKAQQNNQNIKSLLDTIGSRLELLSRQDDCPICLEEVEDGKEAKTFGCCHKVCGECWVGWAEACAGSPFCPLCRHDQFLNQVLSPAFGQL